MDDSKSDNTDDLLTSIEPLIQQSNFLVQKEEYKNNGWTNNRANNGFNSNDPVIVDDILSSRSTCGEEWREKSMFQSPSIANIASHNFRQQKEFLNSDRTISSHFYEPSISAHSTPRNMSVDRHLLNKADESHSSYKLDCNKDSAEQSTVRCKTQLYRDFDDARSAFNQSRTEVQRLQLINKQLSTQLHEAKLSIQTLSIQLEQVQQESKHKEDTLGNLDNTLGKLVSGWKKRESQNSQDIDSMKQHIDSKDRVIEECQRMADESRRALANADKAVQLEKNRMDQLQKTASIEIQNLKNERAAIIKSNQELTNRYNGLELELKRLNDQYSEKIKCMETLNYQIKEDGASCQRENNNLKKEIERMNQESLSQQFEVQSRDDKLRQMKTEMKILEDEVQRTRRDRDDKNSGLSELRNSVKKLQDEHIVTMKKQEKELLSQSHQDMNKRILDIQDQHKRMIQSLQNNFQGKLNDQSKRHRSELERLRHVAEQEIASRVSDSDETVAMLRERLERAEKSVQFWQKEKEVVEKARNQISAQLYELMNGGYHQSHEQVNNTNAMVDLVKPTFVPPKNQHLFNTMPNSFFEPIKSDSITSLHNVKCTTSTVICPILSDQAQTMLSSSTASLYY